jgi:putative FmdB family regulatory protein
MPTYEFRCPDGHDFEKFYRTISGAESVAACPQCGKPAERVMSPTGFAFKGSGFYLTDYGKNAHREKGTPDPKATAAPAEGGSSDSGATAKSEKGGSGSETSASSSSPSTSSSGGASTGESKPAAAKPDAKPAAAPAKKSTSE